MNLPPTVVRSIQFRPHSTLTACWVWTGCRDSRGTPRMACRGREMTARQGLYLLLIGPPPARLTTRCGTHQCVNPHHTRTP